jgi:hypothetical protein
VLHARRTVAPTRRVGGYVDVWAYHRLACRSRQLTGGARGRAFQLVPRGAGKLAGFTMLERRTALSHRRVRRETNGAGSGDAHRLPRQLAILALKHPAGLVARRTGRLQRRSRTNQRVGNQFWVKWLVDDVLCNVTAEGLTRHAIQLAVIARDRRRRRCEAFGARDFTRLAMF